MGRSAVNIYVLTSSRADYSIYLPLLKKIKKDAAYTLRIIAFGSHSSRKMGHTADQILADGFDIYASFDQLPDGDQPEDIGQSIAKTIALFTDFWNKEKSNIHLIIGLGDRYEMYAALSATIPFVLPVAHLHGGETTLGAIDNIFRHSISLLSKYHFTATEGAAKRLEELLQQKENIFVTGALALDNLKELQLFSISEFKKQFKTDFTTPTLLMTLHPETVDYASNSKFAETTMDAVIESGMQTLITLPNADTGGQTVRKIILEKGKDNPSIHIVESLGPVGYYSALKHCYALIGNSSSGIIEAASFAKYVINLGNRQQGRDCGDNVLHVPFEKKSIIEKIKEIKHLPVLSNNNIYGSGNAADKMMTVFKKIIVV